MPGTGDLSPAPVGYIKGLGEKIKYALFNGPSLAATTTIVGIRAGCIFGYYTDANYAGYNNQVHYGTRAAGGSTLFKCAG